MLRMGTHPVDDPLKVLGVRARTPLRLGDMTESVGTEATGEESFPNTLRTSRAVIHGGWSCGKSAS